MTFKLINLWQSSEERSQKYWLAKSLGCSSEWARSMRDWRLSKIERLYHLDFPDHYRNETIFSPYAQFVLPGFFELIHPNQKRHTDVV